MTIVVVDNEPAIVRMCMHVLQSKRHIVHGFTRTDAALGHLAGQGADLLVVDYKMPALNGFDFIQRAWALHSGMRVVLLTAYGTPEVITKAKESGVHTVVVKPFTPAELMAGVARAARGDGEELGERPLSLLRGERTESIASPAARLALTKVRGADGREKSDGGLATERIADSDRRGA